MPTIQFVCYGVAVLLFWLGLRLYTGDPWLALAGAVPLPHAFVVDLMPEILTDALAAALTIAVAAALLGLAARPGSRLLLGALTAAVFATYQVRPAAVFLIGWVPLMAAVLRLARERPPEPGRRRWLLGIGLATVLPYLLFAGARRIAVGHFGLVAFGGTNLAGVTACFLDDGLVAELPQEHRPLARAMLRVRQRSGWRPLTPADDVRDWFPQFSDNIWLVAVGAAEARLRVEEGERLARGSAEPADARPKRIRRNEMLTRASRAIIRARPRLYLKWVAGAVGYGFGRLGGQRWVVVPLALLAASWALLKVYRARGAGGPAPAAAPLRAVAALGLSYFALYLLLLAAVSWPFPRYFSATILFLPSVLCMYLYALWRSASASALRRRER